MKYIKTHTIAIPQAVIRGANVDEFRLGLSVSHSPRVTL
jgi:hypothetical protein